MKNAEKVVNDSTQTSATTQKAPTPAQTETQENEKVKVKPKVTVNVTLPTSPDPDNDYYYNRNVTTLEDDATATKAEDGNYTWQSVTHNSNSTSLNTVLSQSDFVYAKNGSWHNTIPDVPNYTTRLVEVEVQPFILPAELKGKVEKGTLDLENVLQAELENKIEENSYEFPEYTTTTPININFYVEYEKASDKGEVVTTPALPEYTGKVSTHNEALPAPVHPETKDASEKVAPTTSTVKEHQTNTEDTKVTTVAPHATNSNNEEGSTRTSDIEGVDTELSHAQISKNNTHFVRYVSNQTSVTGRLELVAAQKQNSNQAVLPQTGAKTNLAGLLGLMVTGVATILGLAIDKKHKN